MAKSYYIMRTIFDNQEILKTKKIGKRYVHFTLPNGFPLKVTHKNYKVWNGGVL